MRPALALLLLVASAAPAAEPFRAGFARRDISPTEPVPMWGYAARHAALSQGARDPLFADALVLESAGQRVAIVSLDLGRAPAEHSLRRIRREIVARARVFDSVIAASHTHHGPVVELMATPGKGGGRFDPAVRYVTQLEDAIIAAVTEAAAHLELARLHAASRQLEGFNRNRHTKLEPKPSDRELSVLIVTTSAGRPLATLVNFAAHPTTLPARDLRFSADYVGRLKRTAERLTGAPVLFLQGAAGDQSADTSRFPNVDAYSDALAAEAAALLRSATEIPPAPIAVHEDRFVFPLRQNVFDLRIRMLYEVAFFPELIANFLDEYVAGVRPRLTVFRLGPSLAFVTVSGEFFSDHALALKRRAGVEHLIFTGYANGYHQYFPTRKAVLEGGYGADALVSPAAVGAGETIMDAAAAWLAAMR